VTKSFTC